MQMRSFFTLYLTLCSSLIWAQIGFNNPNPDGSAIIDIVSSDKGLLVPRISSINRLAISSPRGSLIVFDTDEGKFYFYNGTQWLSLNEFERVAGSNEVALPVGNLSINGNVSAAGNTSIASLNVSGFSNNALVPTGAIFIWSGNLASIPSGWVICDGTNGTPDLRERFVVGVGLTDNTSVSGTTAYSPGAGGNTFNSISLTANETGLRSHTHTITDPMHSHRIDNGREFAVWISNEADAGSGSSGNEVHATIHPESVDLKETGIIVNSVASSDALQAHENRPPYYALAFIMKLP
jgi:microcystin-dependent protein